MTMARNETQVLKSVTAVNRKVRDLTVKLEAAWRERRDLYAEARALSPPIPHARIAAAAGTTEAAVMQVVAKGQEAALTAVIAERLNGDEPTPKELRTAVKALVADHGTHEAALSAARTMPLKKLRTATRS
jgi:hypothetical protein